MGATAKPSPPAPEIGHLVDDATITVERDNSALKNVLPREYGRDALDKERPKPKPR